MVIIMNDRHPNGDHHYHPHDGGRHDHHHDGGRHDRHHDGGRHDRHHDSHPDGKRKSDWEEDVQNVTRTPSAKPSR